MPSQVAKRNGEIVELFRFIRSFERLRTVRGVNSLRFAGLSKNCEQKLRSRHVTALMEPCRSQFCGVTMQIDVSRKWKAAD